MQLDRPGWVNALWWADLAGSRLGERDRSFVAPCAVPAQTRAPRTRFSFVYLRIRRRCRCVSRSGSAVSTWNNLNRQCKGPVSRSQQFLPGACGDNSFVRGCAWKRTTFLFLEEKKILRALCLSVADPIFFFYRL